MVGCGGFGAANAGAAIIARAAAKEPAIVALAIVFLEFIGVSFPWKVERDGSTTWTKLSPSVARSGGRRQRSWRPQVLLLRMSPLLNYQLRPHNPVMETGFCNKHRI